MPHATAPYTSSSQLFYRYVTQWAVTGHLSNLAMHPACRGQRCLVLSSMTPPTQLTQVLGRGEAAGAAEEGRGTAAGGDGAEAVGGAKEDLGPEELPPTQPINADDAGAGGQAGGGPQEVGSTGGRGAQEDGSTGVGGHGVTPPFTGGFLGGFKIPSETPAMRRLRARKRNNRRMAGDEEEEEEEGDPGTRAGLGFMAHATQLPVPSPGVDRLPQALSRIRPGAGGAMARKATVDRGGGLLGGGRGRGAGPASRAGAGAEAEAGRQRSAKRKAPHGRKPQQGATCVLGRGAMREQLHNEVDGMGHASMKSKCSERGKCATAFVRLRRPGSTSLHLQGGDEWRRLE